MRYAEQLASVCPGSHLHILVRGGKTAVSQPLSNHVTLHATGRSLIRFVAYGLSKAEAVAAQAPIALVTTQSPFLDGVLGVYLSRRLNAPLLVQIHISSLDSKSWLKESRLNPVRFAIAKQVLRRANSVRVVNHRVKSWLIAELNLSPDQVRVLPVSAVALKFNPNAKKYGAPTALYVGRLAKEKGVDILLDAFRSVLDKIPDAALHIIGDGPERKALQLDAKKLGIDNVVRFLGAVAPSRLASHYQSASVLVLPSRHESFGRVIIEAFSAALPVVATQTEGATSLIEDGANGFLVPVEDSAALAERLAQVLKEPALAKKMGIRGRETVAVHTDIDKQTQTLINYWLEVAHG